MLPYVVPFAIFIALSYLGTLFENGSYYFYPIKTIAVALTLFLYRQHYNELRQRIRIQAIGMAAVVGFFVFVIWVVPEGWYPTLGTSEFNPFVFTDRTWISWLIFFRLTGAVVVVPIFEELFWRSFLIRWIINPDFNKVPLGQFSWLSFTLTVIFFGLEHHQWLVGIVAGVIYNLLVYWQKNLWACIIAHAVTNLALGIYVLHTGRWGFW
ncbi:MAG: CAAX prenyl protease-related protein [candidate division KSB1 bacterium]|nr:CAAX prenyl protease-related protein [candidate division KSB1 bacterium]MDZ7318762.1 CAAX prenyl protease-related protein [candidate division KSB1 bacterium]MDZ7339861.1 CAAX prenyl protease-related protein [candidate division KSB1 bacterium]